MCYPGFWAFLGDSVGRLAVLGLLSSELFFQKRAKMGAKRGVFCVFWLFLQAAKWAMF
jgi:hypothetical protein